MAHFSQVSSHGNQTDSDVSNVQFFQPTKHKNFIAMATVIFDFKVSHYGNPIEFGLKFIAVTTGRQH